MKTSLRPVRPADLHRASLEQLEPRALLYSQPVHQTLTELGVDLFLSRFGPAEVVDYRTVMGSGAFHEDSGGANPYGDSQPSLRHFWDRSRSLRDGLLAFDSAPGRAIDYVTGAGFTNPAFSSGGLVASHTSGATSVAYRLLGHIAHLLEDMTVPAHANNDAHLEGYGVLDDPDPYHDWVDGNWQAGAHVTGATGNRASAYPVPDSMTLRSPRELALSFVNGSLSTQALINLFRQTADYASQWASDGVAGTVPNNPFNGAGGLLSSYDDWTQGHLSGMASHLVPRAITGVAELIRYFYGMVDAEGPQAEFAALTSTDANKPQTIRGTSIDLSVLASDQDTGDSGVGKRLFKIEYRSKSSGGPGGSGGSWGSWTTLKGNALPEATDVSAFSASESEALAGLHGVRLDYAFTAEDGKTYAFRVITEDGAGNLTTGEVHYVRAGGDSVDLVLVIDTTGSMGDDINQVKLNAESILADLAERDPGARAGVVLYKDFGDKYITQTLIGLTDDLASVSNAIQLITVDGGGDTPEAVLSALHHAINGLGGLGAWRSEGVTKQIILFGDAPGHDPEQGGLTSDYVINEALAGGFVLGGRGTAARGGSSPITIHGIVTGGSYSAQQSFRVLADATGGQVFNAYYASDVADALSSATLAAFRPTVTIEGFTATEDFRDAPAYFTLRLSEASSEPVTVLYALDAGSASSYWDYSDPGSGVATIPAGATSVRVPITVRADFLDESAETFTIRITSAEGASPGAGDAREALATILNARYRAEEFRQGTPVTFQDADGSRVTVKFAGAGFGRVWLRDDLPASDARAVEVFALGLKNTLAISVAKGARTTLGAIDVSGYLKSLSAPGVDVIGSAEFSTTPGAVRLGDFSDGLLNLGFPDGGSQGASLTLGRVRDARITSEAGLKALTITDWQDTDDVRDRLEVPWIGALKVTGNAKASLAGDLDADLVLSGEAAPGGLALKSALIAGVLDVAAWNVAGHVGSITARAAGAGWNLLVEGNLKSLTTKAGGLGGTLSAWTFGTLKIAGDLASAAIQAKGAGDPRTPSINTLSVKGGILDSTIDAAGDVRSVVASVFLDSALHLGDLSGVLGRASALADVGSPAALLKSFTLKNTSAVAFRGVVSSPYIGSMSLRRVDVGSSEASAVAATQIASYSRTGLKTLKQLSGPAVHDEEGLYVAFTL